MTFGLVMLEEVREFTDQELIARLRGLVRADQKLGARLLVHLGEVDARGLYREQAYSSMFAYCVEELQMSEAEAYLRIQAARLGRQFPLVVQLFEQGALHLSMIKRLGPHLTVDNHVQLLERARGKGKREIELLVAELAPKPDVPSSIRKLPETRRAPASRARAPVAAHVDAHPALPTLDVSVAAPFIAAPPVLECQANRRPFAAERRIAAPTVGAHEASFTLEVPRPQASSPLTAKQVPSVLDESIAAPPIAVPLVVECQVNRTPFDELSVTLPILERQVKQTPFALEAPRLRASCVPLSPGRYKVTFTGGKGLADKLEQLKDLLRHRVPDGDLGVIVELAVDLLFDKTMKQRFAQTQARKQRSIQRGDEAQPQPPGQHRAIQSRDEAQPQTAEQHRAMQRGDERAPTAAQEHALAVRATIAAVSGSGLLETQDRSSTDAGPRRVNSRYIPRAVVREVYARDGGQCTFVSSDGKRCSERAFLELHHHDVPYGKGGKATVDNLRLTCRAHNALFAERDYGTQFMRVKQLQARAKTRTESLGAERVQV